MSEKTSTNTEIKTTQKEIGNWDFSPPLIGKVQFFGHHDIQPNHKPYISKCKQLPFN